MHNKIAGQPLSSEFAHDQVRHMIAERAYFIAESQDFAHGRDLDNWLSAEAEQLSQGQPDVAPVAPARKRRVTTSASPPGEAAAAQAPAAPRAPRKRTTKSKTDQAA